MVLSELDQHEMGFECFDKFFQLRSIAETKETLNQSRSYLEQTYNYIIKKEKDIE
jgi:hypothetical protein